MAMGGGSTGGAVSDMNVTPLIDVLLVLLIIFMVIQPTTPKGLDTVVPQPPKDKNTPQSDDRVIVCLDPEHRCRADVQDQRDRRSPRTRWRPS